jgi:hypothetical protein
MEASAAAQATEGHIGGSETGIESCQGRKVTEGNAPNGGTKTELRLRERPESDKEEKGYEWGDL